VGMAAVLHDAQPLHDSPSPQASSEESDGDMPIPYPDDSGAAQAVSGNRFQIEYARPDPREWTAPSYGVCPLLMSSPEGFVPSPRISHSRDLIT
jgi:hypothetical protein